MATGTKITGLQEVITLEATRKFVVADIGGNESITYTNLLAQLTTDLGALDILTTKGDIISHDGSNPIRLGVGFDDQYLTSSGGDLLWKDLPDALVDPTISNGDLIVRQGANVGRLGIGTENQVLTVSSGLPSWETLTTYTDPLTSNGDLLTRNGGATQRLGIGSNGQVLTVSGGLPSWSTLSSYSDPLTTRGDVVIRGSSSTTRLPLGSSGQVLTSNGTDVIWSNVSSYSDPLTTNGDILRRSGGSTNRLGIGTNGQVLTVSGGLPTWVTPVTPEVVDAVENGGNTGSFSSIKVKVIEIGDWKMDTTVTLNVAHGISFKRIRGVHVIIRDDDDDVYEDLKSANSSGITNGSVNSVTSTNIQLSRVNGGQFDGPNFSLTSYNRGWITLTYED